MIDIEKNNEVVKSNPWERFTKFNFDIRRVKDNDEHTFHFVGDTHAHTRTHCRKALLAYQKRWSPFFDAGNNWMFLVGDLFDYQRTTERKVFDSLRAQGYSFDDFEEFLQYKRDLLVNDLLFTKGCVIGAVEGNHGHMLPTGETLDESLTRTLAAKGGKYCGAVGVIICRFHMKKDCFVDVKTIIFHGKSATQYLGSNLNEVERANRTWPTVDIICAGHSHKMVYAPDAVMLPEYEEPEVKQHETLMFKCGSFQRNYVNGDGNYATPRMWKPSVMRMPRVNIKVWSEKVGGARVGRKYMEFVG